MKSLYIAALDGIDAEAVRAAGEAVERIFGLDVRRLEWAGIADAAFDPRRRQHNSVLILRELHRRIPPDALRLLALTECDLFIPMLSFVFGQAQLSGRIALVSTARLRQEFYRLPPNRELTRSRLVKETLHELGHTFGLVHCPDPGCPMALANSVIQADRKSAEYCNGCRRALAAALRACPEL